MGMGQSQTALVLSEYRFVKLYVQDSHLFTLVRKKLHFIGLSLTFAFRKRWIIS